ncbi:MAG: M55 family metallopeptidase [Clostridia bacterium]|nr:M55 family metallopeptidase [Clostridia bacterium]
MRVYLSVDMEGIAGVTNWEQVEARGGVEYQCYRHLLTAEVNSAVEAALKAGASSVTVNDAHGSMQNLVLDSLHPQAQLISGYPKRLGMMEAIDSGFEVACLLGYHARAGSQGVLAHTCSEVVHRLKVNGQEMGELGLNALLAGYFGVPVVFVSGDQVVAAEARELLTDIEIVIIKQARNYHAARSLSPKLARAKIRQGITKALAKKGVKPLAPPSPVSITIEFNSPARAAAAAILPRSRRQDAVTVTYSANSYLEVYQAVRCLITMAKSCG